MGTIIKSTSITVNTSNSSFDLAAKAGEQCLKNAGINKREVDLLINVGLYRDDNIMEPAIAPLIQDKMGMNLDPVYNPEERPTFSFDITNGVCGFIYAAKVADSALKSGAAKYILIVSSDAHPSREKQPHFPYSSMGAAALLCLSDDPDRGFGDFIFDTSEDGNFGIFGGIKISDFGIEGRWKHSVEPNDDYTKMLKEFTGRAVRDYIDSMEIDPREIKCFITSQSEKGFGQSVWSGAGFNGGTFIQDLYDEYGDPCTSAITLGFHHAMNNTSFEKGDRILFAASGSGLTSGCVLYKV